MREMKLEEFKKSGKSISYPEPKKGDKRPIGATKKDIKEYFIKEHPGLKGKLSQIRDGNLYIFYLSEIHETQIDKQKVKEAIKYIFECQVQSEKDNIPFDTMYELEKELGIK